MIQQCIFMGNLFRSNYAKVSSKIAGDVNRCSGLQWIALFFNPNKAKSNSEDELKEYHVHSRYAK